MSADVASVPTHDVADVKASPVVLTQAIGQLESPTEATHTVPQTQSIKEIVDGIVQKVHEDLWKVNQQIWSNPELAYQEFQAHDTLCDFLEAQGYSVTRHAYGLETAFEAKSGSGGRLVNFNAEYDALPGIGHACGHNLIATSSLTAFHALSQVLKTLGIEGRTQLLGTPAEEGGGGKVKLIQAGAFEGVDVSLMAHGSPPSLVDGQHGAITSIGGARMLAREQLFVEFHGKAAHAGACPWEGQNALDAFVASYNNVSMLRQQIRDTDRIHAAILDAPKVANVIPRHTKSVFVGRSETLKGLKDLTNRLQNCVKAGALATECQVDIKAEDYYADILLNLPLCDRYRDIMTGYGHGCLSTIPEVLTGSTDQGNVSYVVPTLHSMFVIPCPPNTSIHHQDFAACAGKPEAYEIALMVGKTLALLGADCINDTQFYESTKAEWIKVKAAGFVPAEVKLIGGCC